MKHYTYRVSKYNPKYYDEFGIYTKEEWTSKDDIGKIYDNQKFDEKEYLLMEDKYILAIRYLLQEYEVSELVVSKLEKYHFPKEDEYESLKNSIPQNCIDSIYEGTIISAKEAENIIRAMLRDYVWCELYSRNKHFILYVGYDFYLHLICEELDEKIKNVISSFGLFVTCN